MKLIISQEKDIKAVILADTNCPGGNKSCELD